MTRNDLRDIRSRLGRGGKHLTSADERLLLELVRAAIDSRPASAAEIALALRNGAAAEFGGPEAPTREHAIWRAGESRVLQALKIEGAG